VKTHGKDLKLEDKTKRKKNGEEERTWVPVQEGLFQYSPQDGSSEGLLAGRCTGCDKTFFPKRVFCPNCFDQSDMEDLTLSRQGVVYSCTVIQVPPPVGIKAPYAYGYVDITENGVRVPALLRGTDPTSFSPGQKVELDFEPIYTNKKGQEVIAYTFKIK
jgi:uncharacterized OB-fold protein